MKDNILSGIPKVDELLQKISDGGMLPGISLPVIKDAVRKELDLIRNRLLNSELDAVPDADEILASVCRRAGKEAVPSIRRTINGTGVILHTNLGRSCLSERAVKAVTEVAGSYSTLEYDVSTGERGIRNSHVEALLTKLTGAESALVVNNNAAAVLLMLSALTKGGQVITSRGELVEIGGSFRIPDIMESCGAVLKEVGTTNKTKIRDYERAIGPETKALMKVHTSNFRVVGFTESVTREELVKAGKKHALPVLEDLGSGSLFDLNAIGIHDEPTVQESVRAGMDVVCFSGDKMLGGPQAGIAVGKREFIDKMKNHPLARAMRVDKMTLAALEATLRSYIDGTAREEIPVLRMMSESREILLAKAQQLADRINASGKVKASVTETEDQIGGGAVPMQTLPSFAVSLTADGYSETALEKKFRFSEPPVIGRIDHGQFLLHPRTLSEEDYEIIQSIVRSL